ncbi:hypothetical protein FSP39_005068 [Pinctada imbricata]|uniref:C2 domain-containing protein n=1 Tax=Pinctada imbricata TaxID=66713 RepID=A0AA88YH72_PINIB|nr:hypothetical protein FSP39_005068 [Pinctada imbricata]
MGGQQSAYKAKDLEKGGLPQNEKKIHGLSRLMTDKSEHERQIAVKGWDKHDENMKNMQLLKGLFKQLDPSVMKAVGDVRGEIQLSFKYDFKRHLLLVKVIKCRELRSKDMRSKMSDPYVKLSLMPENAEIGGKRTAVVKQSNSPVFDEIFAFPLKESELVDLKMLVQVMDADILGRDDFLGETIVNLNTIKFREDPFHTEWYTLNMETDFGISGELEVTVRYEVPQSLFVTVHRASGLSARDAGKTADPFVKLTIPGTATVFKSQVIKDTLDPAWEETFEFQVAEEEINSRYIIFHVVDEDTFSSNDSLGQVIINLSTFNPERHLHGTYPLADLRNAPLLRSKWSQHSTAQEFREALIAHAASMHPTFLFDQHSGKKVKYCYNLNTLCKHITFIITQVWHPYI